MSYSVTPSSSPQRGSMSRGTAMSISSSGRPSRWSHHQRELLAPDDRVRGGGRGDDDVGRARAARAARRGRRPSRRSAARGCARGRRGGWRRRSCRRPASASACAVSSLVSPAPRITTWRRAGRRARSAASSTATEGTLTWLAPMPSPSARACRSSARRANRRLVSGPVLPALQRRLVGAPDLALDLVLAEDHRLEPRGDAEEVARGVAVARRVDRLGELGRARSPAWRRAAPARRLGLHRIAPARRRRGRARCGCRCEIATASRTSAVAISRLREPHRLAAR